MSIARILQADTAQSPLHEFRTDQGCRPVEGKATEGRFGGEL